MSKFSYLVLFLSAALLAGDALAVPTEILPESSHYEGRSYYSTFTSEGDLLSGRVEFAVYDTEGVNGDEFSNPTTGLPEAPGTGQYIYAYQVFSDSDSTGIIDYFAVLDIGDVSEPINDNIGSIDDQSGNSVQPDESPYIAYSTSIGTIGVWEFAESGIGGDEHSWFLMLRSNQDWKPGNYTFNKTVADATAVPDVEVPEPCVLLLLAGGAMIMRRRRRS